MGFVVGPVVDVLLVDTILPWLVGNDPVPLINAEPMIARELVVTYELVDVVGPAIT